MQTDFRYFRPADSLLSIQVNIASASWLLRMLEAQLGDGFHDAVA
jgi:hypothetical protein